MSSEQRSTSIQEALQLISDTTELQRADYRSAQELERQADTIRTIANARVADGYKQANQILYDVVRAGDFEPKTLIADYFDLLAATDPSPQHPYEQTHSPEVITALIGMKRKYGHDIYEPDKAGSLAVFNAMQVGEPIVDESLHLAGFIDAEPKISAVAAKDKTRLELELSVLPIDPNVENKLARTISVARIAGKYFVGQAMIQDRLDIEKFKVTSDSDRHYRSSNGPLLRKFLAITQEFAQSGLTLDSAHLEQEVARVDRHLRAQRRANKLRRRRPAVHL